MKDSCISEVREKEKKSVFTKGNTSCNADNCVLKFNVIDLYVKENWHYHGPQGYYLEKDIKSGISLLKAPGGKFERFSSTRHPLSGNLPRAQMTNTAGNDGEDVVIKMPR